MNQRKASVMAEFGSTSEQGARVIGKRWQLGDAIRGGGMSEVYRAKDLEEEHEHVVVKLLPKTRQENKWEVKAFELEHQARLAPLRHPNIVPLIEKSRDSTSGETYLVFPYAGERLTKILAENGPMEWDDWWILYGRPVLDALAHAHRQDVAHRDVKPDNIFVNDDGVPQLGDFGTAKIMRQVSLGITVGGHVSVPYAPPEQDTGIHSKTRDLHAWAAITYFAVSGTEPDRESNGGEEYLSLTRATEAASSNLDPKVHQLLLSCLDAPEKRPKVAGELLAKLDEICTPPQMREIDREVQVHVHVVEVARERLEQTLDLYSAEVQDLLARNLRDAVLLKINRPDEYLIIGTELSMSAKVAQGGDHLRITRATQAPGEQIERDRNRGWLSTITFTLDPLSDASAGADSISYMVTEVQAHAESEKRAFQRRQKLRPVTMWRRVLSALREVQRDQEDPIVYRDVRRSNQGRNRVFTLLDGQRQLGIVGQTRMAPAEENQTFFGEVVAVSNGEVVIKPDEQSAEDALVRGELRVDGRRALAALNRQENALDSVIHGKALKSDLVTLLAEPATSNIPRQVRNPTPNQDLDNDKRDALVAVMGDPDLMVVKGPPGTGKTRLIAEIAYQHLLRDPDGRILIASQTHAGLDNALSRIHDLDPSFRLLRIARRDDERVDDDVHELRMDAQLDSWKEEVKRSGSVWLRYWAKEHGVDPDDIQTAILLERLAAEIEKLITAESEAKRLRDLIQDERAQRVEFGSTSASAEAVRAFGEGLAKRREEAKSAESVCRSTFAELVGRGYFSKKDKFRQVDVSELRQKAEVLAPDTEEGRKCRRLIEMLGTWHARFGTTPEFEAAAISRAQIVGATCVGLASIRGLDSIPFDLCVIDEASRASAPELFIPMARSKRFVLVGDEKQLPPYLEPGILNQNFLDRWDLTEAELKTPFFSHLANSLPPENVRGLNDQHRMHPTIGDLVSDCFYDGRLRSVGDGFRLQELLRDTLRRPVAWYSTSRLKGHRERRVGDSIANDVEAAVIKDILTRLDRNAAKQSVSFSVAILAGYRGQCRILESRLASELSDDGPVDSEVHTVDSFQGREADVVIYSVTRSNEEGSMGFLREAPRLNVALSRAREFLVIVGDPVTVRKTRGESPLRDVLEYIERHPDDCEMVEISNES